MKKGKALDTDEDGVIDFYDLEKDTPKGAKVSMLGIAIDTDGDGIIDFKDKEIKTPKGFPVDGSGVTLDEDQDGINDLLDWEPGTPEGAKVNLFGQAIDTDQDGIIDLKDQESGTKTLARVNTLGETDTDGDGMQDLEDQEIQSPEGARIDKAGRSDNDGDGIPDMQDKEWYTPESADINEHGEAKDSDQDGIPDIIDFQVQTPKEFIDQVDAFGRQPDYPGDFAIPEYLEIISGTSESAVGDPLYQTLVSDTLTMDESMVHLGEPLAYTVGSFITAYFLTASIDGNLTIWNAGELNENLTQRPQRLNIPASLMLTGFYLSGNRLFAATSLKNQLQQFQIQTSRDFEAPIIDGANNELNKDQIRAIDIVDLRLDQTEMIANQHFSPLSSVLISPKNNIILTGTKDGIARLWENTLMTNEVPKILSHYRRRFSALTQDERKKYRLTE